MTSERTFEVTRRQNNPLLDNKILALFKLKAFADGKLNVS